MQWVGKGSQARTQESRGRYEGLGGEGGRESLWLLGPLLLAVSSRLHLRTLQVL